MFVLSPLGDLPKSSFHPMVTGLIGAVACAGLDTPLHRVTVHYKADIGAAIVDIHPEVPIPKLRKKLGPVLGQHCSLWEIRVDPTTEKPTGEIFYQNGKGWKRVDVTPHVNALSRRVDARGINIDPSAMDPEILRQWLRNKLPLGQEIRSLDFYEVESASDGRGKTVVFVKSSVPEKQGKQTKMLKVLKEFEDKFGIPAIVIPQPRSRTAIQGVRDLSPVFARLEVIGPEHLIELEAGLESRLQWRNQWQDAKVSDRAAQFWFSIDDKQVVLREDLFCVRKRGKSVLVSVAVPDITTLPSKKVLGEFGSCNRGVFRKGLPTTAWVVDFSVENGELKPIGGPYRARVRNCAEFSFKDPELATLEEYENLIGALRVKGSGNLVALLNVSFQRAIAKFFKEKNQNFLLGHKGEERVKKVSKILREHGEEATERDLLDKKKSCDLLVSLQRRRRFKLLGAVSSILYGTTVLSQGRDKTCAIKPQRGSRQIINQYLLASLVSGQQMELPGYIREIVDGSHPQDTAGLALSLFEEERMAALEAEAVIAALGDRDSLRRAKVVQHLKKGTLCRIKNLGRGALVDLEGSPLNVGDKFLIEITGYTLSSGRFTGTRVKLPLSH